MRRVGFRTGSDPELTSLHAVEAPIQAERGSDRMPLEVASYMAFARGLPSQFKDHAWLAETSEGSPVAAAYCWFNVAGDSRHMECDVLVRRDWRRKGIGSQLLSEICDEAGRERRPLLTWSTYEAVPAGAAFSASVGAQVARINRTSELRLAGVDWSMVEEWSHAELARSLGYRLETIDGPFPDHLLSDAVKFHHIMQTAPFDDLDVGGVFLDEKDIAELDVALLEAGRTRWTILVRDPVGSCVGGTEVTLDADEPAMVFQQNTGIDPGHRGRGLAKWVKAVMLERVRRERPLAERIRTGNAFSNAPMLAINDALGFQITQTTTEWQVNASDVQRAFQG